MNIKRFAVAAAIAAAVGMSALTSGVGLVNAAPSAPAVPVSSRIRVGRRRAFQPKNAGGTGVPGVETPEAAAECRGSYPRARLLHQSRAVERIVVIANS